MIPIENKKVSIIIPTYNNEKTIERCINSLLKQSYDNFEILVINDGSTDQTLKILQQFKKNKKITILNQVNKGVSVARNFGIKKSTGEYLSFVDADDFVEEKFLQDLITGMKKGVDLSIIGLKHIYPTIPEKQRTETYYEGEFSSSEVLDFLFFEHGPKGYLPNKLWKRDVILKNNIFLDPTLNVLEDTLFTVKYLLNSKNVIIKNNKDYNYVHEGETLTSGMSFTQKNPYYIQTYQMMIKSVNQIIDLVSKKGNKDNEEATLVFLGMIYKDYLRHLLVYGKIYTNKENYKRYKKIRKKLFRLRNIISKNNYLSKKNYSIFMCTLYTPFIIKMVDSLRKNNN